MGAGAVAGSARFHAFDPAVLADPEAVAAARVMRQGFLQHHLAEELAYLDAEPGLPREWVDAATSGDTLAYLTPDELRELSTELDALPCAGPGRARALSSGRSRCASSTPLASREPCPGRGGSRSGAAPRWWHCLRPTASPAPATPSRSSPCRCTC
ncbi:MAG: hypothetical protein R2717_09585 [Schumannella sp.]